MRPMRGRSAAGRQKTIISRTNKPEEPKVSDEDHKKLTGPLKKRPIVTKKISPTRPKKNEETEVVQIKMEETVAMHRARRTPKPNPKYSNENIISLSIRGSSKKGKLDYSDLESDELDLQNDDSQSVDSDEIQPEEDMSDSDALDDEPLVLKKSPIGKKRRGRPPGRTSTLVDSPYRGEKERKLTPTPKGGPRQKSLEMYKRILDRNRRLDIEFYDSNDSKKSGDKRTSTISKIKQSEKVDTEDETEIERRGQSEEETTTGAASTLDDFETMPTFTIVNIHDIINKKGDVLIAKSSSSDSHDKSQERVNSDEESDKFGIGQQQNADTSPQTSRNRRKSMHTTILSDKIDHSKLTGPPPKSPFPLRKPPSIINDLERSSSSQKPSIIFGKTNKAAPRILNSFIAKKAKPVPTVIKVEAKDHDDDATETLVHTQSKENHYHNTELTSSSVNKTLNKQIISKKIIVNSSAGNYPSRNVVKSNTDTPHKTPNSLNSKIASMNNFGTNTRIGSNIQVRKIIVPKDSHQQQQSEPKKVTYVDTWTVVESPPELKERPEPRPVVSFSLPKLGKFIKKIQLPSSRWNYRVGLQKVPIRSDPDEAYTSDTLKFKTQDQETLQPVNITFRRRTQKEDASYEYDRTVSFRNGTYTLTLDNKNVCLIAAPQTIDTLHDIECLLKLMDCVKNSDSYVAEKKNIFA